MTISAGGLLAIAWQTGPNEWFGNEVFSDDYYNFKKNTTKVIL